MIFARINYLITDIRSTSTNKETALLWLTWASYNDTFLFKNKAVSSKQPATGPCFQYNSKTDGQMHFVIPKDQLVNDIHDDHTKPVFRGEEAAYCNKVGFEYLKGPNTNSPLYSRETLFNFFKNDKNKLKGPISSIEVKAKQIHNNVKNGSEFTTWSDDEAYKLILTKYTVESKDDKGDITPASWTLETFTFSGLHIEVKMAKTPKNHLMSLTPT